ncbi:MAG: beta-galactosidase, partial [Planctomycetota bacterium]
MWDPTNAGHQPRGKQVKEPRGIWYTAVTGIWQTVWLEAVPETYIESIKIVPDLDSESVHVLARSAGETAGCRVEAEVKDWWFTKAKGRGKAGEELVLRMKKPKPWSPDSPFLYDLKVTLRDGKGKKIDAVSSYFGMRKIEVKKDKAGINRLWLNNEVLFQFGPLDQGWWPDGLYAAPTDAALRYDIEVLKKLGCNMLRKHVKVEPARLYYWCDKLGLMVWQDMPN